MTEALSQGGGRRARLPQDQPSKTEGTTETGEQLESRLKTALDESRLLILGGQVLFGFYFECAFQDGFADLPVTSRNMLGAGLLVVTLSVCLLIAPSLHHQIRFDGDTRIAALKVATGFTSSSLFPMTLGMGAAAFVVFARQFGTPAGVVFGTAFTLMSLGLLYGVGFALLRSRSFVMPQESEQTPLQTKIEQMLTEARVIIPGGQALLGFQFIATLTTSFDELPQIMKEVHALALCAVALSVVLLMTPATVHRIAFHGENNERFFRIGSRFVVAGTVPLAVGIAADLCVVFYRLTSDISVAVMSGCLTLALLCGIWFVYPLWRHASDGHRIIRQR